MTKVDDLITYGQAELGKPYSYGDEGPNSFDCSGLMQFIFGEVGVKLPRTAHEQQTATSPVTRPLPGDLVFWGNPAYHVALYIGGGKVIAAPEPGARVQVQDVWGTPAGYGRVQGLGTALAPALGIVTTGVSTTAGTVANWLGGGRYIVLEAGFVLLGVGLLGYGVWKTIDTKGGTR